jgi:hypothetical protein
MKGIITGNRVITNKNMNTGYQRSLTVKVVRKVDGIVAPGYEYGKGYDGRGSFVFNGIPYEAISTQTLASMPYGEYSIRLTAFKQYVQAQEPGLLIDETTVPGEEAYRENYGKCPLGV